MFIINPLIVDSSADGFLDGKNFQFYTRLMEFRSNELIQRSFYFHDLSFKIKKYDISNWLTPGDFFYSFEKGVTIATVAVSPEMTEAQNKLMFEQLEDDAEKEKAPLYILDLSKEVPGSDFLFDLKGDFIKVLSLDELKEKSKNLNGKKV